MQSQRQAGPELSPETLRRLCVLFSQEDQDRVTTLLREHCGNNLPFEEKADMYQLERIRFAALKYSDGNLLRLEKAVDLARRDWRDLLMAAGFAERIDAHKKWEPIPAGVPSEIDALLLAAAIHERLATMLSPLGFLRHGDEWCRTGEVPQTVRLVTGLTSRIETRFFLRVRLEAKPVVMLHLPKLPGMHESREQGYFFHVGDTEEAVCAAIAEDVVRYVLPLLQRFTTLSEVRRGFEDGPFQMHLMVEDQAWLF